MFAIVRRRATYARAAAYARSYGQVWVDKKTASSAEVLAAALHDNCRARVVGKTTYGKGVIQARRADGVVCAPARV